MLTHLFASSLFAANAMDELDAAARSSFRLDATDTFIVLGAAVILVGLVFLWAFFLRKRPTERYGVPSLSSYPSRRNKMRRRSSSGSQSSSGSSSRRREEVRKPPEEGREAVEEGTSASGRRMVRRRSSKRRSSSEPADFEAADKKVRVRKRRRRHHPDNYPRNPTLGETGGLPPLRPDDPDPGPEAEEPKAKPTE